tara:strand:+ start:682 stop:870 length:189 start_codon:yes stop_codon:yes gene_type:complete
MKNYAVLITGEVTRSIFVMADNPEQAQVEACSEWTRMTGGEPETAKIILLEENKNELPESTT